MFAAVIFQLDSQSRRVLQENPYEGADNPQELVPHQPFSVGKAESTSILDCIPILHCRYIRALKSYLLCVSSQPSTSAVDTCFAASLSQHLKEALEGWALLPPSPFFDSGFRALCCADIVELPSHANAEESPHPS